MRLLRFHDQKLVLTDFSGKTVPPYAILSHRWNKDPNSEVLFEDVGNDTWRTKAGRSKVEFCAKQAAKDRLQYFWIDTCCIDKWNSQERAKAVNSMFRWYQNAAKCYVFLADVPAWGAPQQTARKLSFRTPRRFSRKILSDMFSSRSGGSFRQSDWFRRGWTLQELIAPAVVEFFSAEGERLGDKESLKQVIHEITGIPIEILQGYHMQNIDIRDCMAWAKFRTTTEMEDIAYCLLGILNISMPLSYGEGKEKALSRLREEIQASKDHPYIIPFSQNERFVGRQSELAEVEAKLFAGAQTTTIAITGEGGTGKSQLALEIVYRARRRDKECSIFWIDASNIESLRQAYASIAEKLKLPGWADEKTDVVQLVKAHLSAKSAGKWLLVLDNVDDVKLSSNGLLMTRSATLTDCLPQSELGSVIFTTTNSDTAKALASSNVVELRGMAPESAPEMLNIHLIKPDIVYDEQEVQSLLQDLSYLPLAIVLAAAYINMNKITMKDYRLRLAKQKEIDLGLGNDSADNMPQDLNVKGPVALALMISLDQLLNDQPPAAGCLFLAACVDRRDIPLSLLRAASDYNVESAIKALDSYALVTRRPADDALDLHRLVHQAIRSWLQNQGQLSQWCQQATRHLVDIFPDKDHSNRSKWRRLVPHAKYALSQDINKQESEARTDLMWKCAMVLYSDGRYDESEQLFRQVVETDLKVLGEEHPDTLTSMGNLALTYHDQGRWKEAEELGIRVMETRVKVLGEEDPATLASMGKLALMYSDQGRWKEAEKLGVRVIETSVKVLGEEHPSTLASMGNLAVTYWEQGRWKEAEELGVRVMETRVKVLGEEHPSTLTSMGNLAATYSDQGRWKEAEELRVRVVETRVKVLGEEHPNTLSSINNLASTYSDQGRWKEAEELEARVIETSMKVFGEGHPITLSSMGNLASTYSNQGQWKEAEELGVRVIEKRVKVFGEEHPDTLTSMNNLALTYSDQGRWKEAEELKVRVLETKVRVLGEEHPSTLTSMNNLAFSWEAQGRLEEAIELMDRCVRLMTKTLGTRHHLTLSSVEALNSWELEARG